MTAKASARGISIVTTPTLSQPDLTLVGWTLLPHHPPPTTTSLTLWIVMEKIGKVKVIYNIEIHYCTLAAKVLNCTFLWDTLHNLENHPFSTLLSIWKIPCPFRILKLCGIERVAPRPGWYCYCSDKQSMFTFSVKHIRLYSCIFQIHNMDLSCPSLLMDKLVLDETSDYGSRETSSEEGIGGLCQVKFKGMQPIFQETISIKYISERIVIFRGSRLFLQADGIESKLTLKCSL